jgi:CheY-like chemotaxis protein
MEARTVEESETAGVAPGGPAQKRHVLVAEDDPDMRRLVAALLRAAGHKVAEARDGMEIIDRIESTIWAERPELFDVIVSDVNMPGLSGLDVLAALRCTHFSTPVILITAYGDDDTRAEARDLGAAEFLDKPLDPHALRIAVERATARLLAGGRKREVDDGNG